MPVPEAAVNKNHSAVLRQYDIGATRQIPHMKPIAEAARV